MRQPAQPAPCSVLFNSGCLFEESSGPFLSLKQTAQAMERRGHQVTVLGSRGPDGGALSHWGVEAHAFRRYGPFSMHYAPGQRRWLESSEGDWDIASLQGPWLYTNRYVADWCRRRQKPYMITVHGCYNAVALGMSRWKKLLARQVLLRRALAEATCYQALSEAEYRAMRRCGVSQPICIVGNGITLPDPDAEPAPENVIAADMLTRRTCLYLGRLHPIKGIELLLHAWGTVRPSSDWQLVVAGDGDSAYVSRLRAIAHGEGCANVHFVGAVTGEAKASWLRLAELFVLPSRSEAFPMALMEAFSYATPALITTTCGLDEAVHAGTAIAVPTSAEGYREGLEQMLSLPSAQLQAMGDRARSYVAGHYHWDIVCAQLESVYRWMQHGGRVPACIRLD